MNKITCLIICSILSVSLASTLWYPENAEEIGKKCHEETNATDETEKKLQSFTDAPDMRALLLCRIKAMKLYNDDTGFNIDRMATYIFEAQADSKKPMLQECADKHKDLNCHAKKVFKTIKCIYDTEGFNSKKD